MTLDEAIEACDQENPGDTSPAHVAKIASERIAFSNSKTVEGFTLGLTNLSELRPLPTELIEFTVISAMRFGMRVQLRLLDSRLGE